MASRSYTRDQYRAAYKAAGGDPGPWALESNPDRNYRTNRRKPILGIVAHITAGLTDYSPPDASAEGTSKYGATTTADASWHVTLDSDTIIPAIRDAYTAWHAGVGPDYWSHPARPYINDATLGCEQGTSQVDWRRAPTWWVEGTLRNFAVWAAPRVKRYRIPLVVIRDRNVMGDAILAGRPFGFIAHAIIAPHNRRDPGLVNGVDTYPWAQLFAYIREELALLDGTIPPPALEEELPVDQNEFNALLANGLVYSLRSAPTVREEIAKIVEQVGLEVWGYKNTSLTDKDAYAWLRGEEGANADEDVVQQVLAAMPATIRAEAEAAIRKVLGGLDQPAAP